MAIRSGFDSIRVLLNNITNNQPSGVWSGNNNIQTYLNKGIYIVNYNVSYNCNGTGPITNSQTVITSGASFTNNGQIIVGTSPMGQLGNLVNNNQRYTLSNTFIISGDATPIYVYLSCTLTGATWGTTNVNEQQMNIISFTKISSL